MKLLEACSDSGKRNFPFSENNDGGGDNGDDSGEERKEGGGMDEVVKGRTEWKAKKEEKRLKRLKEEDEDELNIGRTTNKKEQMTKEALLKEGRREEEEEDNSFDDVTNRCLSCDSHYEGSPQVTLRSGGVMKERNERKRSVGGRNGGLKAWIKGGWKRAEEEWDGVDGRWTKIKKKKFEKVEGRWREGGEERWKEGGGREECNEKPQESNGSDTDSGLGTCNKDNSSFHGDPFDSSHSQWNLLEKVPKNDPSRLQGWLEV